MQISHPPILPILAPASPSTARLPWVQSSDFEAHPLDPPLSDAGRAEAKEVGKRIAQFIEAKPGSDIQAAVERMAGG